MHILRAERQWCLRNNVDGYLETEGKVKRLSMFQRDLSEREKSSLKVMSSHLMQTFLGQAVFGHFGATRRFPDRSKN